MALRNLLADRFELVARRETREGRGFALREQLGLRLEPITTAVETVVVTSLRETPTPD